MSGSGTVDSSSDDAGLKSVTPTDVSVKVGASERSLTPLNRATDPGQMFEHEKIKWAKQTADELCQTDLTPTQPGIESVLTSCPADAQLKYNRLDKLLDRVVSKYHKISEKMANKCEKYLTAGEDANIFYGEVKKFDNNRICGKLLYDRTDPTQYIMYRCKTCGLSDGFALCQACFQDANHTNLEHDYHAFDLRTAKSSTENYGTCDCGDDNCMKPEGCCTRHGRGVTDTAGPPKTLLSIAEFVVPKIILRILLHNRKYQTETGKWKNNELLSALTKLTRQGSVAHDVLTRAFTDPQLYAKFNADMSLAESRTNLHVAIGSLDGIVDRSVARKFGIKGDRLKDDLGMGLEHYSCLDEMTFWLVHAKYPKKFVVMFMNLLPNPTFKYELFQCFVRHYSRIGKQAMGSKGREGEEMWEDICCQLQLFVNHAFCTRLVLEHDMHMIMLTTVFALVHASLTQSASGWSHLVVKPKLQVRWWYMLNNFHYLLGKRSEHKPLSIHFLNDPNAIKCWACILIHYQAMLVNRRQLEEHIGMERGEYWVAVVAEKSFWAHLGATLAMAVDRVELASSLLAIMRVTLEMTERIWQNGPESYWKPDLYDFTLHLPLQRHLATFLLRAHQVGIPCPLPSECFLRRSFMGPLGIQVARAEIGANMWVRNGQSMKQQSAAYSRMKCFIDLDTYWMHHCACNINANWFMLTVIDRFHLADWLDFSDKKREKQFLEPEWVMPMLEGALKTIAVIASPTTNLGMNACKRLRLEICTLLCQKDRGYNLFNALLELDDDIMTKLYNAGMLEDIIKQVAEHTKARVLPSGRMSISFYSPTDNVWIEDFDPLFCMYRHNSAYQSAMHRYTSFVEKKMKESVKGGVSKDTLWPPFRIPTYPTGDTGRLKRLLQNRVLHAFIWNVLYQWWIQASSVTESAAQICINLLELAVTTCEPMASVKDEIVNEKCAVLNLYLSTWFSHDCILQNLCKNVKQIVVFKHDPVETQPTEIPDLEAMQLTANNKSNRVQKFVTADSLKVYAIDTKDALTVNWDEACGQEPNIELIETGGQTLLSLLMNLYDRMTVDASSYYRPAPLPYTPPTSRIGTGCLFISNILNMAFSKNARCKSIISAFCAKRDAELPGAQPTAQGLMQSAFAFIRAPPVAKPDETLKRASSDEKKKGEARKKARAKLMEEYKAKQKQSMAKHKSTSQDPATSDTPAAPKMQEASEDICAICSESCSIDVFYTEQRFIGLPVRYRPTTILGLSKSNAETGNLMDVLPEQKSRMDVLYDRRTYHFLNYLQSLAQVFSTDWCYRSVNSSWYSSIRMDSCGHYIHSDCLHQYLKTKPNMTETGMVLSADQFQCPVCRRVYNGLIPLLPNRNTSVEHMNHQDPVHAYLTQELQQIYNKDNFPPWFQDEMLSFCRKIWGQFDKFPEFTKVVAPMNANVVLLFDSILRTKLELDSFKSGSSSEKGQIFSASLLSLMSVGQRLILYERDVALLQDGLRQSWKLLQGEMTALTLVPILLQDPIALLLQFTQYLNLCMAPPAAHELVECSVGRLVALQTVVTHHFSDPKNLDWHLDWQTFTFANRWSVDAILGACKTILSQTCAASITTSTNTGELSESMIKELDAYSRILKEWGKMVGCSAVARVRAETVALVKGEWSDAHKQIADGQIRHLMQCVTNQGIKGIGNIENPWKTFLQLPNIGWDRPRLVRLPRKFHSLYTRYSALPCFACANIPLHPHICLLCAQMTRCCADARRGILEHTNQYHAGFSLYLSVTWRKVMVVSGDSMIWWGHVYVDENDQEPDHRITGRLILCDKRFELLEKNWIEGIFVP